MEKTRVLIVEDDGHLLSGIKDILELEDFDVMTAQNGREGLEVLRGQAEPPNIIVSDIMMPHMDGYQFLEEVRKEREWKKIPFIFLTAKGEKADKQKGLKGGADHFLTKPFDAEDLIATVEAALARVKDTELVYDAEKVEQLNKIMTIINHELRTPLTLVVGYSEMLRDTDVSDPEEVRTFVRGVNSGADRLRRLVDNFIFVVELTTGEADKMIEWRKRPTNDFGWIYEEAHRQIALPHTRPRNYEVNIASDLPMVNLDTQYVTIALRELLDNAAKFSSANATVRTEIYQDGDYLAITVTDEGRGIPAGKLEEIWQPFFQINRELFEDQGSGSGLAIVDGVVKLHKGTRHVESIEGKGSRFTMRLPIEQ
jgi:signal transduction histidine kinase